MSYLVPLDDESVILDNEEKEIESIESAMLQRPTHEIITSNGEYDEEETDDEDIDNIIILQGSDGNAVKFEFLDLIEYQNEEYVVLLPVIDGQGEDSGEVVILHIVEEDPESDEESYCSVDDEETLNTIFEIFKEKFKDEFDFSK